MLNKELLRNEIQWQFMQLSPIDFQQWNGMLERSFFQILLRKPAKQIMLYYSVRKEVNTLTIIANLLQHYPAIALPICLPGRELRAGLITDLSEVIPARFGLREPPSDSPVIEPEQLDFVVIPGLAFDEKGNRLGHGAGYYDRFLARTTNAYKLGFAYDFQVLPEIPCEPHDIPLDGILTPTRFISIRD